MSVYEQGGQALPTEKAARKARVARMLRRILAVPFWVLLALFVLSWPLGEIYPTTGGNAARFLAPILLIPITLIRAMPTTRVVGLSHYRQSRYSRRPGCLVGFGFFCGVFVLTGAANVLAPALVPTVPVNAEVTKCHRAAGGEGVDCFGSWTVNGTRETDQTLPVSASPGSTVRVEVSKVDDGVAYAQLSGGRRAMGMVVGAAGALVTGASLFELTSARGRIRRRLDDVIAGRATVPAKIVTGRPRPN